MREILKRFYKIARAEGASRLRKIGDMLFGEFEKNAGDFREYGSENRYDQSSYYRYENEKDRFGGQREGEYGGGANYRRDAKGAPVQVVEDLAVFGLRPPSSLEEVKKARNREIKKYHSDRFVDDPEKYRTSKEIMQIYNAAYDRLKLHFKSGGGTR